MVQRYSFLAIISLQILGLHQWSASLPSTQAPAVVPEVMPQSTMGELSSAEVGKRRDLLEVLDHLVAYEHYYRSVYGHFTKMIHRLGFTVPSQVAANYEIRVVEATSEKLLISAFSEERGRVLDVVSVDRRAEVHANFPLPAPRPEYLRMYAFKQLRSLKDLPAGQVAEERGVFRDYFKYDVRKDSQEQRIALAVGIRPPVLGLQIELGPNQDQVRLAEEETRLEILSDLAAGDLSEPSLTGQRPMGNRMTPSEEMYLAQRIFHGEMGRYAKTWSELSRIANFRFEARGLASVPSQPSESLSLPGEGQRGEGLSLNRFSAPTLEIEPVNADE